MFLLQDFTLVIMVFFCRWTEKWLRRWRGVFCSHNPPTTVGAGSASPHRRSSNAHRTGRGNQASNSHFTEGGRCEEVVREFRSASCSGSRVPLLDELKDQMECDTFNGAQDLRLGVKNPVMVLVVLLTLTNRLATA